jgi:hypothetical protein
MKQAVGGLALDAVIDGSQTAARVRFDLCEPPQQGACERVDCLIGHRSFIPVANGGTLPLRLPRLGPTNFLGVGHRRAIDLEPGVEVWVVVIGPGEAEFFDAPLENLVMTGLAVGYHGETRLQCGIWGGVGPGLEKDARPPLSGGNRVEEFEIGQSGRLMRRHNTPFHGWSVCRVIIAGQEDIPAPEIKNFGTV